MELKKAVRDLQHTVWHTGLQLQLPKAAIVKMDCNIQAHAYVYWSSAVETYKKWLQRATISANWPTDFFPSGQIILTFIHPSPDHPFSAVWHMIGASLHDSCGLRRLSALL